MDFAGKAMNISTESKKLTIEGSVIIVSILLAFAIDAGWEKYQETQQESEILIGLERDFQYTLQALAYTRVISENYLEAVDELFPYPGPESHQLSANEANLLV